MHHATYHNLPSTPDQSARIERLRAAAKQFGEALETELPDGPDKDHVIRAHRINAMWANVAATRLPDGGPRPPDHGVVDTRFAAPDAHGPPAGAPPLDVQYARLLAKAQAEHQARADAEAERAWAEYAWGD